MNKFLDRYMKLTKELPYSASIFSNMRFMLNLAMIFERIGEESMQSARKLLTFSKMFRLAL